MLLPHVQRFNASVSAARLRDVAKAMGVEVSAMNAEQGSDAALAAIENLSRAIDIPAGLALLGAKEADIPTLASNALKDACGLTNPRVASQEEIEAIFKAAF
ncbi:Alcohol dehydrogenase 2 [compost metagenome]